MKRLLLISAAIACAVAAGCGGGSNSSSSIASTAQITDRPATNPATPQTAQVRADARRHRAQMRKRRQESMRRQARHRRRQIAAARRTAARRAKSEAIETKKAESEAGPKRQIASRNTEQGACGDFAEKDLYACEDSFDICSAEAPTVVEKSYHEEGEDMDEWAYHYAHSTYTGHADKFEDLVWQAGYAGCLAAINGEYERLYR